MIDDAGISVYWKIIVALTDEMSLSPTKHQEAENKYYAVGEWLCRSNLPIFKDAFVYSQGSMRMGTTVKPYGKGEYDIDLILHLPYGERHHSPDEIRESVGARLRENKKYEQILKELNRGWCLDYTGDFHLDITPSIPNSSALAEEYQFVDSAEFVPDKKREEWKDSNPKGFAEWFDKIDEKMPISLAFRGLDTLSTESVEELPSRDEFKGFLKRTIQLLKRHRDVFFEEKLTSYKEYKPISVLITTIAARAYRDLARSNFYDSPVELLIKIIKNLDSYIKFENGVHLVLNPTNIKENFAEKWSSDKKYKEVFLVWQEKAFTDIEEILKVKGLDKIGNKMNESFGSKYVKSAMDSLNKEIATERAKGLLAGGIISTRDDLPNKVPANTFFGSGE